jgi:hypothetical protein
MRRDWLRLQLRALVLLGVAGLIAAVGFFDPERGREPAPEERSGHAFRAVDSWTRSLPLEIWLASDLVQLPPQTVAPVVAVKQAEAQAALQDSSWQPLSVEDVKAYVGKEMVGLPSCKVVLLRGLFLEPSQGMFSVYWRDGVVLVRYGCLGRHEAKQVRKVVVALLPAFPREVYVDCEMTQ